MPLIFFKRILTIFLLLNMIGCTSGFCRKLQSSKEKKDISLEDSKSVKNKNDSGDKILIYKYDGSLQCNLGDRISLDVMAKELKGIKIYSKTNKHDGLMHIQVCGSPTGKANVFKIDSKEQIEALNRGFKIWNF